MSSVIYYFSGTGNSLQVAKDLAKQLDSDELIPVAKLIERKNNRTAAEIVGFVFPVYCMGIPQIMVDFIKKIQIQNHPYIFCAVTYAGMSGSVIKQMKLILKEKGHTLSAAFKIVMPTNSILAKYPSPTEAQQQRLFQKEKKQMEKIGHIIKNKTRKRFSMGFNPFGNSEYQKFINTVNRADEGFWTNSLCKSCGVCEVVCPVSNIKMVNGKPQWQHHCQQCLACTHYCPTQSIQSGETSVGKKRYHHPSISMLEIAAQKSIGKDQ